MKKTFKTALWVLFLTCLLTSRGLVQTTVAQTSPTTPGPTTPTPGSGSGTTTPERPPLPNATTTFEAPTGEGFEPRSDLSDISLPDIYKKIPLSLDITPEYPGPYEDVSMRLISYATNLNNKTIYWYVNGVLKSKGLGQTTYKIKTGAMDKQLTITASISDDVESDTSTTIQPTSVDMVWQSSAYVPPFYKGKTLYPRQGDLNVIAFPSIYKNGQKIKASNLIYKWSMDDKVLQDESGYGKNIVTIQSGGIPLDGNQLVVDVTTVDGQVKARGIMIIESYDPKVLVYRKRPLYGLDYSHALNIDAEDIYDSETSILAVPYFFSTKSPETELTYTWMLNNDIIKQSGSSVTLGQKGGQVGEARIDVEIKHQSKDFQRASFGTNIVFGKKKVILF